MQYRTIRSAAAMAAVLVAAGVISAAATPAYAAADPETKTVTTNIVDRADHGHGSPDPATWALDTFVRTVTITGGPAAVEVPALTRLGAFTATSDCDEEEGLWTYHAVVSDEGTFVTQAGPTLSPNAGAALAGGVPGTMEGGFTADFEALAHWCSFDPSAVDGKTIQGDAAPSTPSWVSALFGEDFDGSSINDDWGWTYKTCAEETWWDAADKASDDGTTDAAGDITGKPCPTPAPTTTPAPTDAAQLPVTGASLSTIVMVGAALVLIGAFAILALRRRRV